jgi:deoxycytidylate deaminase
MSDSVSSRTPFDEHEALRIAVEKGAQSPCSKSKRGVVIWSSTDPRVLVAGAHNGPPPGFACDGSDACRKACGQRCVHAEQRALTCFTEQTDLLHVKVVDGEAVPSGPPSCVACSKVILDRGIQRVWLLHETGLRLYSAHDFHVQSLLHHELPLILSSNKDPSP